MVRLREPMRCSWINIQIHRDLNSNSKLICVLVTRLFYESIGGVTVKTVKIHIEGREMKNWMHGSAEVHGDAGGVAKEGRTRLDFFAG